MASRINKRFAMIVGAVIVVAVASVVVGYRMWKDPATYIAKGEAAFAEGDLMTALQSFGKAYGKETVPVKRVAILKRLEAVYQKRQPKNISQARELTSKIIGCYSDALALDETDLWASENLLDHYFERARRFSSVELWNALYQQADRVLEFTPDHKLATYCRAIAGVMRVTQRGMGDVDVNRAREDLDRAMSLFPADGKLVYYNGIWCLNEAAKARALNDTLRADTLRDQGFGRIDAFLAQHPDDIDARAGRFRLALLDNPDTSDEAWRKDALAQLAVIEKLILKGNAPLDATNVASYLVTYDTEIVTLEDGVKTTSGLRRGEALLRDAVEKNPDFLMLQIQLAENLSSQGRRDDAIAVLTETSKDRPLPLSLEAFSANQYRAMAMHRMAEHYIAKWSLTTNDKDKQPLKDAIDSLIAQLDELVKGEGVDPSFADLLRGRLALQNNDTALAKVHLLRADKSPFPILSSQAQLLLYRLHRQVGDTGAAQEYLAKAMETSGQHANKLYLQLDMAHMLIESNQFDSAIQRLERLNQLIPDDPNILMAMSRARIRKAEVSGLLTEDRTGTLKDSLALLDPIDHSENRQLMLRKANLLARLKRFDESMAMIEKFYNDHPEDFDMLRRLVQMQRRYGAKEKADALVADARAKHPDEPRLKALTIETAEEMVDIAEELIPEDISEVRRQLTLHSYYTQLGEAEKARAALDRAIELEPEHPNVLRLRFVTAITARDWAEAESIMAKATAMNDGRGIDYDDGDSWRGQLLFVRGKYAEAESALESAQDKLPKDSRIAMMIGQTRLALGNLAGAERSVAYSLTMRPNNVDGWLLMHQIHDRLQRHDQALLDLRKAHAHAPENRAVYRQYLAYLGRHGDPDVAIELRRRDAQSNPKDINNRLALGDLYIAKSRLDEAREVFGAIRQENPDEFGGVVGVATVLRIQGKADEGAKIIRDYIEARPDVANEMHWVAFARYLVSANDVAGAEAAYKNAVAAGGGDNLKAVEALAGFYFGQRRFPEASAQYALALQRMGADADADKRNHLRSNYARTLIQAGQLDRAERAIAEVLAERPNDVNAILLRVTLQNQRLLSEATGEQAKASIRTELERLLDKAVDLARANPRPYLLRARYYFNSDDEIVMAEVRDDLERARALNPSHAEPRELMARWHLKRNDIDSAVQELRGLISARPDYRPARLSAIQLCLQHSRLSEADLVINDSIRQFPDEAVWYEWSGRKSELNQDLRAAERDFAKAYAMDRNVIRFVQHGRVMLKIGKFDAFLSELRSYPEELSRSASLQAMRARALYATGKKTEGLNAFHEALGLAENKPRDLASVLIHLGTVTDTEQRLGVLEPFLANDKTGQIELAAIQCYLARGQQETAIEKLKALEGRFEAGSASLLQTHQLLARTMYELKRYEESSNYYLLVIKSEPNNLMARNNIAYILADELDNPQAALEHAEAAGRLTVRVSNLAQRANVLDTLGYIQYRLEKYSDAERTLRQSATLHAMAANRLHLAMVLIAQDRPFAAKEELRKARELVNKTTDKKVKADIDRLLRELEEAPATLER